MNKVDKQTSQQQLYARPPSDHISCLRVKQPPILNRDPTLIDSFSQLQIWFCL